MGLLGSEVKMDRLTKVWFVLAALAALTALIIMGATPNTWVGMLCFGLALAFVSLAMMRLESDENLHVKFTRQ